MLHRILIPIGLVLAFTCTQLQVVTHEIIHLNPSSQPTQPDKNTASETCSLCIAHVQSTSGLPAQAYQLMQGNARHQRVLAYAYDLKPAATAHYSSRAPPHSSAI